MKKTTGDAIYYRMSQCWLTFIDEYRNVINSIYEFDSVIGNWRLFQIKHICFAIYFDNCFRGNKTKI